MRRLTRYVRANVTRPEFKSIALQNLNNNITSGSDVFPVNDVIAAGPGSNQRIGRQIRSRSFYANVTFKLISTAPDDGVRCRVSLVYIPKNTDSWVANPTNIPTATWTLNGTVAAPSGVRQPSHMSSILVLASRSCVISASNPSQICKIYKKWSPGLKSVYNDAPLLVQGFFVLVATVSVGSTGTVQTDITGKYTFTDD